MRWRLIYAASWLPLMIVMSVTGMVQVALAVGACLLLGINQDVFDAVLLVPWGPVVLINRLMDVLKAKAA